jgi:very-short-patch-repair endonuclease
MAAPVSSATTRSTKLTPDQRLAKVARRQLGLWNRRQALAAGLTDKMIRTRIRRGDWLVLDTAVYAHATSLPTWDRSVMAAILAEPWAAASHRSAAVIHELVGFRHGRPEITVRPGANARGRLSIAHRGVDVDVVRSGPFTVTTVAQTFVDLSQMVTERRFRKAFETRIASHPATLEAVRDRYSALAPKGGRNLSLLKQALLRHGNEAPCAESELERTLHAVTDDPRIPEVHWQAPFPGQHQGAQRVDGLIPAWSMVLEGDGRAWHTRVEDFERDRRRDAEAAAHGLLTLRFTWNQLDREPAWVRRTIVEAGRHRAVA